LNSLGSLYLIPAPIAEQDPLQILSPEVIEVLRSLRHFIVESERTAVRFLSKVLSKESLASASFSVLDEHSIKEDIPRLLKNALSGDNIGLISEAGCPCVADPGSDLVAEAHKRGVRVIPLSGPSSILMALMASGFTGQKFLFLGYIPAESTVRKTALKQIERDCILDGITRIFIEAPYRSRAILDDALKILDGNTHLCIAASLGSLSERVRSGPISLWRETPFDLGKEPAVFLLAPRASGAIVKPRAQLSSNTRNRSIRRIDSKRRDMRFPRPSGA